MTPFRFENSSVRGKRWKFQDTKGAGHEEEGQSGGSFDLDRSVPGSTTTKRNHILAEEVLRNRALSSQSCSRIVPPENVKCLWTIEAVDEAMGQDQPLSPARRRRSVSGYRGV